ncbi:MAG: 2Fe-2S iron-sulfur cluster binding domain-containing protein [Victivallales bacterium]|jgi:NADP-reducing hydrogenase subunit HndD|nr:2Fe-2S iron-sulfur cluster binding domain-containing protein [Victivallales bacterium]
MSSVTLTIDKQSVTVPAGTTILDAAKEAGISIPTLCYFDGVSNPGSCRVCLVEVEGARTLQPSCVTAVGEGMAVRVNTKDARDARRLSVELMLANHPWDCNACVRSGECELQTLAQDMGITDVRFPYSKEATPIDTSTAALVRDMNKCVLCRRCVAVCQDTQGVGSLAPRARGFDTVIGTGSGEQLSDAVCVQCGQCAAVCPVGAIYEQDAIQPVWAALDDPTKHVVVQTAPAIRAALGECFGCEPGTVVTGKMVAALRRLGFDKVFDTNFTADLTIIEEGTELLVRLKNALVDGDASIALPMFTSCSPGWINYMEAFYPQLIPNLSSCKSPQQMFGALAKTYYAEMAGVDAKDIVVVSIMPCTAKKYECARDEMNDSGFKDVDYVLTTRELGQLIKEAGIDFLKLEDEEQDTPMGMSTGAADIFANTGGVMEAALRTVYELVTGRELPTDGLHVGPVQGLEGVKEAELTFTDCVADWSFLEGVTAKVAVAHGLTNAKKVCDLVASGEASYHFIEVMCCPGGCIGGGGQPRATTNDVRKARISAIYQEDEGRPMRKSHTNPAITAIYENFLGEPGGHKSHHLLHTHYVDKKQD